MASLYKKPVRITDPKSGQKFKTDSKKWWGRYVDADGVERRVPLAVDKKIAQRMLNELVEQSEQAGDRPKRFRSSPQGVFEAGFSVPLTGERI